MSVSLESLPFIQRHQAVRRAIGFAARDAINGEALSLTGVRRRRTPTGLVVGARLHKAWQKDFPDFRNRTFPGALFRIEPGLISAADARAGQNLKATIVLRKGREGTLSFEIVKRQLEGGYRIPHGDGKYIMVPFQKALRNPRIRKTRLKDSFVIESSGLLLVVRRKARRGRRGGKLDLLGVLVKRAYTRRGFNSYRRLIGKLDAELVRRFNAAWRDELREALRRGRIGKDEFRNLIGA